MNGECGHNGGCDGRWTANGGYHRRHRPPEVRPDLPSRPRPHLRPPSGSVRHGLRSPCATAGAAVPSPPTSRCTSPSGSRGRGEWWWGSTRGTRSRPSYRGPRSRLCLSGSSAASISSRPRCHTSLFLSVSLSRWRTPRVSVSVSVRSRACVRVSLVRVSLSGVPPLWSLFCLCVRLSVLCPSLPCAQLVDRR